MVFVSRTTVGEPIRPAHRLLTHPRAPSKRRRVSRVISRKLRTTASPLPSSARMAAAASLISRRETTSASRASSYDSPSAQRPDASSITLPLVASVDFSQACCGPHSPYADCAVFADRVHPATSAITPLPSASKQVVKQYGTLLYPVGDGFASDAGATRDHRSVGFRYHATVRSNPSSIDTAGSYPCLSLASSGMSR